MNIKFANNATTYLAADIDSDDTTLSVYTGGGALFPTLVEVTDYFKITVQDSLGNYEIMHVTAVDGDDFTVTRAQESTTAKAFSAGAVVENRPTAGFLEEVSNIVYASEAEALAGIVDTKAMSPATTAAVIDASSTAFAKTLLDDTTASAALTTLGVSTYAKTILDDATASDAQTTLGISTYAKTLIDDASASDARTTLGLGSAAVESVEDILDQTSSLPIGSIYLARDGVLASGVLECAGSAVSRNTYRDLFYGSGIFPFDLTEAQFLDEKGSITTFTVDTASTSGHFDAPVSTRIKAGCRIVLGNGGVHPIVSITGDGTAANSVVFSGTRAVNNFTVSGIYGCGVNGTTLLLSDSYNFGTTQACTGGTAAASLGTAANAFDADDATYWRTSSTTNGWLRYYWATAKTVWRYRFKTYPSSAKCPKNWTFEGSNDATNWTVLDTHTNVTDYGETVVWRPYYEIPSNMRAAYKYYRINVSECVNAAHDPALTELEMNTVTGTYPASVTYPLSLLVDCTDWSAFKALSSTETLNSQSIWYAVSFDGGTTYSAFAASAWLPIVRNNAGTWEYWTGSAWAAASINSALGAMAQAAGVTGNRMTGAVMAGLSQAQIEGAGGFSPGQTSLPVLVALYSTSETATPVLSELKVSTDPSVPSMPIGTIFGAGDGSTTFNLPTLTAPTNCMYVITYE